jgi:hypothetical protein
MSDPFQMIIEDLGQKFVNDMVTLFNEQPSLFEGRSTRDEWIHQVLKAKADLEGRVGATLDEVEESLHGGDYPRS